MEEAPLDIDTIVEKLEALGLRTDEARIYLKLLRTGPSSAGTVAPLVEFSRSKTYRVLGGLVDRGYVDACLGTPTLYEAKSPAQLFERQIRTLDEQVQQVRRLRQDLLDPLMALEGSSDEGADGRYRWRNLQGRPRAYRAARDLVQGAEDEIVMMSSHEAFTNLVPLVEDTWEEAVEQARDDGVTLKVLLDNGLPKRKRILEWAEEPNVEVRVVTFEMELKLVVVDREEAVQWLELDPSIRMTSRGDVAVRSDAPGLVGPPLRLFRELWEDGNLLLATA